MNQSSRFPVIIQCTKPPEPWRLFAKKEYNENVKTDSYEINLQSKPFDNDIRNPKLDWFSSHYNRLGYQNERPWTTTTSDMLNQRLTYKEIINPNKKILSYYTYHDKLDCEQGKHSNQSSCISQFEVNDYITTMQHSYKPRNGFKTKKQSVVQTPFYFNRRFRIENIANSTNKFWDDNHLKEIKLLHKYKPDNLVSYDFTTGMQSDGTPLPEDRFTLL